METNLREALDRSIGEGPPLPPPSALVAEGHRRLRRRRWAGGATTLLVATVAVGGSLLVMDRPAESPTTEVAGPPTAPSPSAPRPYEVVVDERVVRSGEIALLGADGVVRIGPDAWVGELVPNPYGVKVPARSAAAAVTQDGETTWWAAFNDGSGSTSVVAQPVPGADAFVDWVTEQAGIVTADDAVAPPGDGSWPGRSDLELVRFADSGEALEALPGVTVLRQRANPEVGDSFARPADRSAVAEVRTDGRRWYVLARQPTGAPAQYIAVSAADGGASLEDFLALARGRYAEGGGGLL